LLLAENDVINLAWAHGADDSVYVHVHSVEIRHCREEESCCSLQIYLVWKRTCWWKSHLNVKIKLKTRERMALTCSILCNVHATAASDVPVINAPANNESHTPWEDCFIDSRR